MHLALTLSVAIPIILGTCWLFTANVIQGTFPRLRGKRICLLVAHPDDEAMFFAPSVLALTEPQLGNHVKILCLSSGNADGLGDIRKRELLSSASILGLRSQSDVFVIEDPAFPDSMTTPWSSSGIAAVLSSAFSSRLSKDAPTATIDVLITFDRNGVSGHPNHTSLYHGAVAWLKSLMKGKEGWVSPVDLYTLTSTTLLRKYMSMLDAPVTMIDCLLSAFVASKKSKGRSKEGSTLMYVSDFRAYRRAQRAMTTAHRSQMRWFRWGWIAVGRYMVVNDLKREIVI